MHLSAISKHAVPEGLTAVLSITSLRTWVCCKNPDIDLRYCSDSRYGGASVCGCRFLMLRCPSCIHQILVSLLLAVCGGNSRSSKHQHVRLSTLTAVPRVIQYSELNNVWSDSHGTIIWTVSHFPTAGCAWRCRWLRPSRIALSTSSYGNHHHDAARTSIIIIITSSLLM